MRDQHGQRQRRRDGAGEGAAEDSGSRWVFGGVWLLLLGGTLLVGGPWVGFHAILLGGFGLLMAVFPPVVALPRAWWWLAGGFVIAGMMPLLPAAWFAMPEWRAQLAATGVATGALVTMQPQQTAEILGLFAITLLTGLWLAGHRASAAQLRWWASAFTIGVAGYAVLAKIMQPPPVSDIPGGGVVFGFFPNRNHTGTYLAMGVVCGLGCVFQALRDKRWVAMAVGLLGAGVCLWAVTGWSISRGSLMLAGGGCLAWLAVVGPRYLGKNGRWVVGLLALVAGGLLIVTESAATRRLVRTLDQTSAVMTQGEGPPGLGSTEPVAGVADLDFRIPILLDSLRLVRDFAWTGIGAGQFYYVFPQYRDRSLNRNDSDVFHPDNDWLWLLAETGPLATAAFGVLVILAMWQSLKGILRGRDRALRGACLVAAVLVPLHGCFDVPGHRLTLAWSSAFLFGLSLGPPVAGQVRRAVAVWPTRVIAVAMLAASGWLAWAQWGGGPQPAYVAGQVAVDQALTLYQQDLGLQQTALARGEVYQPEPSHDLLEQALARLEAGSSRVPLDREIPHLRGLLALQFDDKIALVERSFAIERVLDPGWVAAPLQQAAAWGTSHPARVEALWQEALRRADRVDRVKPGTVWGRHYTMGRIIGSARGKPELEMLVPKGK